MTQPLWRRLAPAIGTLLFGASLAFLARELEQLGPARLSHALRAVPSHALTLALILTIVNYALLTLQDQLAVTYAGATVPRGQVAFASFIAYAVSNSVGFALLSGTSARYRFYARWGVGPGQLSRIVLFYSVSFWVGLGLVAGGSLLLAPPAGLDAVLPAAGLRAAGAVILLVIGVYIGGCLSGQRAVRFARWTVPVPTPALMAAQVCVSVCDWLLAAGVLFVLLPPAARPAFLPFAGAFAAAQFAGLASHVPGGLGVFDSLIVVFLRDHVGVADLASALVAYRVIYYIVPLAAALVLLLMDAGSRRPLPIPRFRRTCHAMAAWATPRILAVFIFAGGALLLFSGVTPGVPERLGWLAGVLPPPLLEASHFTASIAGLALLVLAQAIARRVDVAFYVTGAALAIGAVASLLKGVDYEEAGLLSLVLAALLLSRRHFTRRSRILAAPLSWRWAAAITTVIVTSVWLGLFAYRHVAYRSDLWWQFAVDANAPRFLRATVGVTIGALILALRQLLAVARPHAPAVDVGGATPELDRVIALQPRTLPYLVYLGDKSVLWNDERTAYVMYATSGSTCLALGDPVGPVSTRRDLVRRFVAMSESMGLTPAFYQATADILPFCADAALTAVKLGEEAAVDLTGLTFAGSHNKDIRTAMNRLGREGYCFSVLAPDAVAARIAELQDVSDDWLASKGTGEKGFSMGSFDEQYVTRFPAAVIERDRVVEAFATLWPGPGGVELSPDLMRHRTDAPAGVMDALFAHTMLWGHDQGYHWFNMGMAPLSGIEGIRRHDTWARVSRFVYRHGAPLYNFQGLRSYKDKFHPVWQARYLTYPGGLALARVLADVTALIAGGYRRMLLGGVRRAA